MDSSPAPIPYVIRIGVTGHRRLTDEAAIASAVERLLCQIENTLESVAVGRGQIGGRVTPLEWLIISPIAKGADRIVASAVLKRTNSRLQVITPFLIDEYRKDFDTPDDHSAFEELLARAENLIALGDGEFALTASKDSDVRNEGYERVGRMVVDQCEVLIAIWNGRPAAGRGGTGDIVQYAIDQGRIVVWINAEAADRAPVLLAASQDSGRTEGPMPGISIQPLPADARSLSRNFHQLAAYNRDGAFDEREYTAILTRNLDALCGYAKQAGLTEAVLDGLFQRLLPHYARADQLAAHYQRQYTRGAVALYGLAALAVTIAAAQALLFSGFLWLISIEIAAMLLAVALWRRSRREAWHEKWLHDRHLAEQIRTLLFMELLGPGRGTSVEHAQRMLSFYRSPDTWVRDAYTQLVRIAADSPPHEIPLQNLKCFLVNAWIRDQANWHSENAALKESGARWSRRVGVGLFVTTLVMACLHLLGIGHGEHGHGPAVSISSAITCLAIVLPAWGAAVHAINVLRDRERIADRSHRMARALRRIAERAERSSALDELREHAIRAEEVMATENLEWWISLSFRELELPA